MLRPDARPLDGPWTLHGFEPGRGLEAGAHLPDSDPPGGIPARVPGTVQAALVEAGLLPDPYRDENARLLEPTALREWWYRVRFTASVAPGRRLWLRFAGVDCDAEFWLNGERLGRHVGMFSPVEFDIAPHLRPENLLAVRLDPPPRKRRRALKAQFGYRWDFAPRIVTSGLWDEVTLFETGPARIADLFAASDGRGLRVELRVEGPPGPRTLRASVAGLPAATCAPGGWSILHLPTAGLGPWDPWDRGEPALHALRVALEDSDAVEVPVGLRTVERTPLRPEGPGKSLWSFKVNGRREFLRGANWVPPDSLLRLDEKRYEELLRAARDANINFLRVWGGGLREPRLFYDLCDRLGLLVWQDLPFACKTYEQSRAFCDLARQEAAGIVRELRNHPSLFLWCGGNEYSAWRNARLFRALEETVRAFDPTRPYHPSSPRHGDVHDWNVWHMLAPLQACKRNTAPFVSEFGLQACPSVGTMKRMLSNPWPPGPGWRFHKASMLKLNRYVRVFLKAKHPALEEHVDASQRAQAAYLKMAIEHHRRRKDDPDHPCGGLALWMWNEPWPCVSWSVVEHSGERKRAFDAVRESCQPLLPSLEWRFRKGRLRAVAWALNDTSAPFRGALVAEGPGGLRWEVPVGAPADGSGRAGEFEWEVAPGAEIRASLRSPGGAVVASNLYETFREPVEWFPARLAMAIPHALFT
ncbi:MAG: glycoside hydrolase family 2 TIM barrel-domain containing protein [Halobacteria archaeon]